MRIFKGHELVEVKPLRGKTYYRCQLCRGLVIDHEGIGGFVDEDGAEIPPDDSKVPQCEGPIKREKNDDT